MERQRGTGRGVEKEHSRRVSEDAGSGSIMEVSLVFDFKNRAAERPGCSKQ